MDRSEARRIRNVGRGLEAVVLRGTSAVEGLGRRSLDAFAADADLHDMIYFRLMRVSDAVRSVMSSYPAIVERHPHVPWSAMRELGDDLHHRYYAVDAAAIRELFRRGDVDALVSAARSEMTLLGA